MNKLAKKIHENAVAHGWWEEERSFGDIIALCHSELSEALEEYRNDKPYVYCELYLNDDCKESNNSCLYCQWGENEKPEGVAVELADCIIRILDWCGKKNIDIDKIIKIKHEYNKTRPFKHGGKKI